MLENKKYDPEDIESLMLHKSFDELYEEEKEFVLQHTDSAEEYESLRNTLLMIQEKKSNGPRIAPRKGMKAGLMAEFGVEKKDRWAIWLNNLFPFMKEEYRPRFALAVAAIAPLMILAAVWFYSPDNGRTLAENHKTDTIKEIEKKDERQVHPSEEQTHENGKSLKKVENQATLEYEEAQRNNADAASVDIVADDIEEEVPITTETIDIPATPEGNLAKETPVPSLSRDKIEVTEDFAMDDLADSSNDEAEAESDGYAFDHEEDAKKSNQTDGNGIPNSDKDLALEELSNKSESQEVRQVATMVEPASVSDAGAALDIDRIVTGNTKFKYSKTAKEQSIDFKSLYTAL